MTKSAPRKLDFWFDYSCPYAYLASRRIESVAQRLGAELTWQPMLLGGVFRAVGTAQNLSETLSPAKARHNGEDFTRWAKLYEIPLQVPSGHPMRTVEAMRATIASGNDIQVIHGFYRAYWAEGRVVSDPSTIRDVVRSAGHDPDKIMQLIETDAIKNDLRERTDKAVKLGIFGAPTVIVDDGELYWGQDRLALLEPHVLPTPSKIAVNPKSLELYWDFSSPYSYLGVMQAAALARRTSATVQWRPMLLGAVFKNIGQNDVPLASWPMAKQQHAYADMKRCAEHWGIPFQLPSRFPMNSVKALRTWMSLPPERRETFLYDCYRAYWAEDRDISDDEVLKSLIGTDADAVLERTKSPEIKKALIDATQRAVDAGVFGAPTWVVGGTELIWGQDRIPLVERALLESA